MAIYLVDDVPTIGGKALRAVVNKPGCDLAIDGNTVVVIQGDQLVQLPGPGQGAGFVADAFHHAAVAQKHIGVVVHDGMVFTVKLRSQQFFGHGHAHRIGNALAQRAGGGFDTGRDIHFGVARCFAVQLAEVFQLSHG